MDSLVSVLIPTYNNGEFVKESIDSIINQTYSNIEIVVVDSSDDLKTIKILDSYGDKIKRYNQPHNGISKALNFGLEHCNGDFIARIDGDDIAELDRIEKQVTFLKEHPEIDVLGSDVRLIDDNNKVLGEGKTGCYSHSQIASHIIFYNCIKHPTVMMRASLVKEGWKYSLCICSEDYDLWTRLIVGGKHIMNIPDQLVKYRTHTGSLTSSGVLLNNLNVYNKMAHDYACELFHLDGGVYDFDDFYPNSCMYLVKYKFGEFLTRQYNLLNEICERNIMLQKVKQEDLIRELNRRWNCIIENSYFSLIDTCNALIVDESNVTFFKSQILEKLKLNNEDDLYNKLSETFDKAKLIFTSLFKEYKKVIIYGMGNMGKRVLDAFLSKQENDEISWEIIAVADHNTISYEINGEICTTIQPSMINGLNPDYVLVSSNKYFDDISNDLHSFGIDKTIIKKCDWIFNHFEY
jgi:glycosyltransferase involved in cell wall biosynthesis